MNPTVKVNFVSSLFQKSFGKIHGLWWVHAHLVSKLIPLSLEHLLLLLEVWGECDTMASLNCCWLMPRVSLVYISFHCPALKHLSHIHAYVSMHCYFISRKGYQHVTADPKHNARHIWKYLCLEQWSSTLFHEIYCTFISSTPLFVGND